MSHHFTSTEQADAQAVQAFLRSRAGADTVVGPFALLFSDSPSPYANYAIPADFAEPTPTEVAALEAAFRARARVPRLEYVPAAAPAVEAALVAAGFRVELRPPLMTRRAGRTLPGPDLDGLELAFADDPEGIAAAARAQAEAFAAEEPDAAWLGEAVANGGRVLLGVCRATGETAGAGAFLPPIAGVTEVVGIGVRPAFQRRGLGQAITGRLAEAAFSAGCGLFFLSAAGEAQAAIYGRAGFVRRAPMLFLSKSG